ncbi:hypothetical protein F5884DRAFT_836512, partial [Xylogone sp. PMI_703]
MESHEAAVNRIAAVVRAFYGRRESYRIFHGSTNSTRPVEADRILGISTLPNMINVNPLSKIAVVELNILMDKLGEVTLEHGLIPPVVMDLPGIMVRGGYEGSGGERSSFRLSLYPRISGDLFKATARNLRPLE